MRQNSDPKHRPEKVPTKTEIEHSGFHSRCRGSRLELIRNTRGYGPAYGDEQKTDPSCLGSTRTLQCSAFFGDPDKNPNRKKHTKTTKFS